MNLNKIGKYIAKKRVESGLTQERLAEELDVSDRAVSKWERGINMPELQHLSRLCEILDVELDELMAGEDIERPEPCDCEDRGKIF